VQENHPPSHRVPEPPTPPQRPRGGRRAPRRAADGTAATRALLIALIVLAGVARADAQTTPISVLGDSPSNGIFDPSVEYDPVSGRGWLAYSAVFGGFSPFGPNVETHIASSPDGGASWQLETVAAPSIPDQLVNFDGGLVDGFWNAEVPSLAYDPTDPGKEWKLFVHRIFRRAEDDFTQDQNLPGYSWIGMRTAATPSGPWSAERALLSSGPLPIAPYDQVEVAINELDPSLSELIVYSEPGAHVAGGTIYLSLTGLRVSGPDRIVLLASDDHGDSWRYVSTPLSPADIVALGYSEVDGTAIVSDAGRVFLLGTPGTDGSIHQGTFAIEFSSLETGLLARSGGIPKLHLSVPPQPGEPANRRGGQADYHEANLAGGLIQPALQLDDWPVFFTISNTGVDLVAAPSVPGPAALAGGSLLAILVSTTGMLGLRIRTRPEESHRPR